jgi:Cytochrome C oxidase subunit II, transmembrane domain
MMILNKTFCDASVDWQFGFQELATPTAEGILDFHDYLVFFLYFNFSVFTFN